MLVRDMLLGGLVVNADPDLADRRTNSNTSSLGAAHPLGIVRLADPLHIPGIVEDRINRQHAGMIVIGDVKTCELAAVFEDPLKHIRPAIAVREARRQRFERAASLAGHLAPHAHVLAAVVMDIDGGEILFASVTSRALAFHPRNMG